MPVSTNGHPRRGRRAAYPARYSAAGLFRRGLRHRDWPHAWRPHPLKSSHDVVIVGGGVHGLAAAYYLAANHGITDVAVLDQDVYAVPPGAVGGTSVVMTVASGKVVFGDR